MLSGTRGAIVLIVGLVLLAACAWRGVPGAAVALAGAATSIVAYVTQPIRRSGEQADQTQSEPQGPL